jgi:hypothetical protein
MGKGTGTGQYIHCSFRKRPKAGKQLPINKKEILPVPVLWFKLARKEGNYFALPGCLKNRIFFLQMLLNA